MQNTPFPVQIPVFVVTDAGSQERILTVTAPEQTLIVSADAAPRKLLIDPEYDLFRRLAPAERRPLWSRLLGDPTRTVVLPGAHGDKYAPLIAELRRRGFRSVPVNEVNRARLGDGAYLFLDSAPEWVSAFSKPKIAPPRFILEITANPFTHRHVIGLIQASDGMEVQPLVYRLFHYGHYCRLEFSRGQNVVKEAGSGDLGIQVRLPPSAERIPDPDYS
jgi:hypothetical protein